MNQSSTHTDRQGGTFSTWRKNNRKVDNIIYLREHWYLRYNISFVTHWTTVKVLYSLAPIFVVSTKYIDPNTTGNNLNFHGLGEPRIPRKLEPHD